MGDFIELEGHSPSYANERRAKVFDAIDIRLVEIALESHLDEWYEAERERARSWINQERETAYWSYCQLDVVQQRFFDGMEAPFFPEREAKLREKEQRRRDQAAYLILKKRLEKVVFALPRPASKKDAGEVAVYKALWQAYRSSAKAGTAVSFLAGIQSILDTWQREYAGYLAIKKIRMRDDAEISEIHRIFFGYRLPSDRSGGGYASPSEGMLRRGFAKGSRGGPEIASYGNSSSGGESSPYPDEIHQDLPALRKWTEQYYSGGIAALQEVVTMLQKEMAS